MVYEEVMTGAEGVTIETVDAESQYMRAVADWEQSKQELAKAQENERHLRALVIAMSPKLINEGEKSSYDQLPDGRTLVATASKRYRIVTKPELFAGFLEDLEPQWRDAVRVQYAINKTNYRSLPDTVKNRFAHHLDIKDGMTQLKFDNGHAAGKGI